MKIPTLAFSMLMAATMATAEVKIALDTPPDMATSGSYNWVAAFDEVLTANGMTVRQMPRGSIGNEDEIFDQISTGLLEVSVSDVRAVARIDNPLYGLRLPYIFEDAAHMDRVLEAGDIFAQANTNLAPHDVVLLSIVPIGPASGFITTNATIRAPADMSNLRMRALDDAQLAMYAAWGSSGTIVSWGEIMTALQTGVVDGYLNSPFVPISFGQTDVVRNFSDAGVIIPIRAALASRSWYESLSDDERAVLDEAVTAADRANRAWLEEASNTVLSELEELGVSVQRLTAEERALFREGAQSVYESSVMSTEDTERWMALAEETR
ncbi:TRAP transporter substrate-binding protein [Roseinatronobacter alkalisoli]|uniref:TRAP transporter substrate-binding protein n=1 Tax=Roseinatronobacter alkalisoli TaxID=3028235 RepID=A0ABT5TB45_9RHOB|nr:TRAP transporter substrate-binding protein [Roseinatronobacter sp. HJB301]MDD7972343.1 TRAP transporter substrate-binding protein [Roseinatronobacter sp. HJB301]